MGELAEPFTMKNLPSRLKGLPTSAKRAWLKAFNNSYRFYLKKGKPKKDAESLAFATANSQLKKMGWTRSKDGKWTKRKKDQIIHYHPQLDESLTLDSTDGEIGAAKTLTIVSFHGRLHNLYRQNNQDYEKIMDRHAVVVRTMNWRGVRHNKVDALDGIT